MRRVILTSGCAVFAILSAGCDEIDTRNCPPLDHSGSNSYQLDYELVIPTDCPVPLGIPGQDPKYAAAVIYDNGNPDFYYAVAEVENSAGLLLNSDRTFFGLGQDNREQARPSVAYIAATGRRTFDDYDYGYFVATNSRYGTSAADPYGRIRITYTRSALATRGIDGPQIPSSNTVQTWAVQASGGMQPYSYAWYRDGAFVGNGSSYSASSGTADFSLRVEVSDQTTAMQAAVLAVDVDGVRASISGPTYSYASQGGGTWTVTGAGGTLPYTFKWYVDGVFAGSGSTWHGYPGESEHELQVVMTDAAGRRDMTTTEVIGFGSGDGTCDPAPGQFTCSTGG